MTTSTKDQTQKQDLEQFCNELLKAGYKVAISSLHPFKWVYIEKNGRLITIQPDHFYNFNYSSVYKPSKENGTGLRLITEEVLSLENVENAFKMNFSIGRTHVVYYGNIEEYITDKHTAWAKMSLLSI